MDKFLEFATDDKVLPVLASIALLIYGVVKAKYFAFDKPKEERKKKLVEIGEVAVKEVYDNYVRELKKGREDGKLTKDEIKTANDKAIEIIKIQAAEKGLQIGKLIAKEFLPVLINRLVKKAKGKK